MGKITTITCDKCGKNIMGTNYIVISISTVIIRDAHTANAHMSHVAGMRMNRKGLIYW